jgi:large conductance mechanosensitive channel
MKNLFLEFRQFAVRGNVIELAIAVVIGTAFSAVVSSLVGSVITPLLSLLTQDTDFSGLGVRVGDATVAYGVFLQSVLDFIIIAFAVFLAVKVINAVKRKEDAKPEKKAELSREAKLLVEIRDELRRERGVNS